MILIEDFVRVDCSGVLGNFDPGERTATDFDSPTACATHGDPDDDNDGILDDEDNCPFVSNAGQEDEDGDELGDVCDACLGDPFNDQDGDGLCTAVDNCPSVPNPLQGDDDDNGIGNVCEIVPVAAQFRIRATEVTNAQYVEFLSAVAVLDPNQLFNFLMSADPRGGIHRADIGGLYAYSLKPNMGDKPVNFVSWLDAARYVNWLHHGKPVGPQGPATTETGAYDLTVPSPGSEARRQVGAIWFLPTRAEWDAAAYLGPGVSWRFPTRSDKTPTGATADLVGDVSNPGLNVANFNDSADWNSLDGNVTTVGSCGPLSTSHWGTYDQGGNVAEWVETPDGTRRWVRGGSFEDDEGDLGPTADETRNPLNERDDIGFRVARPL